MGAGPEFDLIRRFYPAGGLPPHPDVAVGPGDDCAVVRADGLALSSDMSVEDVHFRRHWISPFDIGYRAAMAALSDLAAMAARPIGMLVSLAAPAADAGELAVQLMTGARTAAEQAGGALLGGDLTRSPGPLAVDVTVVGEAAAPVLRSGARPGDSLWVTGHLGASALAVDLLLRGERPQAALMERFAAPRARVREARWLAERQVPRAMLDLSDGLLGDVAHLTAASGVAVVLERAMIPVHPGVREAATPEEALRYAVAGGEDYELCFAASAGMVEPLVEEFRSEHAVALTRVGVVEEGSGVFWRADDGGRAEAGRGGYQHFGGTA